MNLSVINSKGAAKGKVEFADDLLLKGTKGTQAVHEAVVAYLAHRRSGSAKTKNFGEVRASGRKPWRQKGTGNARVSSRASPIWRGGGVVFGPRPRDYNLQVPKKVKALAFRKALSERLLAEEILVLDELVLPSHKTKELLSILNKLDPSGGSLLIVVDEADKNLKLAARNLPGVAVERAGVVNVYQMLRYDHIIATQAALEQMQARVGKS